MIPAVDSDADVENERENRDTYPNPERSTTETQFCTALSLRI
jgi:hypothetical protein